MRREEIPIEGTGYTVVLLHDHTWERPVDGHTWSIENGLCARIEPAFGQVNGIAEPTLGLAWPFVFHVHWTQRAMPTTINGLHDDERDAAVALLTDTIRVARGVAFIHRQLREATRRALREARQACEAALALPATDSKRAGIVTEAYRVRHHVVDNAIRECHLDHDEIRDTAGITDLAMTVQLAQHDHSLPPITRGFVDIGCLATMAGIAPNTASSYKARGLLPAPDIRLGGSEGWTLPTVLAWLDTRRGAGARTDLDPKEDPR